MEREEGVRKTERERKKEIGERGRMTTRRGVKDRGEREYGKRKREGGREREGERERGGG